MMHRPEPSPRGAVIDFAVVAVLVCLVPLAVAQDRALGTGVSEYALTEIAQSLAVGLSAVIFALGTARAAPFRGYFTCLAALMAMMLVRENDFFFDGIFKGLWAALVLVIAALAALRARALGAVGRGFAHHAQHRAGATLWIGLILLILFSRLFGTGSLWQTVMGDAYVPVMKTIVQEGTELMGYALILSAALMSWRTGFGARPG